MNGVLFAIADAIRPSARTLRERGVEVATPTGDDEGDATRVAPVDKLSVARVAASDAVFLGERLSALNGLGVALTGFGAVLVAWRG